jgi:hypothetical protein
LFGNPTAPPFFTTNKQTKLQKHQKLIASKTIHATQITRNKIKVPNDEESFTAKNIPQTEQRLIEQQNLVGLKVKKIPYVKNE